MRKALDEQETLNLLADSGSSIYHFITNNQLEGISKSRVNNYKISLQYNGI